MATHCINGCASLQYPLHWIRMVRTCYLISICKALFSICANRYFNNISSTASAQPFIYCHSFCTNITRMSFHGYCLFFYKPFFTIRNYWCYLRHCFSYVTFLMNSHIGFKIFKCQRFNDTCGYHTSICSCKYKLRGLIHCHITGCIHP